MKYYLVLDTNVLVSALISKSRESATVRLLNRLIIDDSLVLLLDDEILREYKEVISRPKFSIPVIVANTILDNLKSVSKIVEPALFEGELPDPKDVMFVEVSLSVPDSKIVSGNLKHFPGIKNVMSPADFLKLIENK